MGSCYEEIHHGHLEFGALELGILGVQILALPGPTVKLWASSLPLSQFPHQKMAVIQIHISQGLTG